MRIASLMTAVFLVTGCSDEPVVQKTQQLSSDCGVNDPANYDRSLLADPQIGDAARSALQRYFALYREGRTGDAAALWRNTAHASAFEARLQKLTPFFPNIAEPGRQMRLVDFTCIPISLQLLRRYSRGLDTLSNGQAMLRCITPAPSEVGNQILCRIEGIMLQPPPVPVGP